MKRKNKKIISETDLKAKWAWTEGKVTYDKFRKAYLEAGYLIVKYDDEKLVLK
jgi:hypothetical protein